MRLFVGIDFSPEIKEQLHRLSLNLERHAKTGSFVPLENFHLTLAFIGETKRINEASEALARAAKNYTVLCEPTRGASFDLTLAGIGSFKQRRGHTWWVGVEQDAGLQSLQRLYKEIVESLRDEGFDLENRSYKPHITIARSVELRGEISLEVPPLLVSVSSCCLFSSKHVDGRQEYSILAQCAL